MRRTRTNYAISFIIASVMTVIVSASNPDAGLGPILIDTGVLIYLATGRLKDMNANPWWSILVILPFVGFILMFPKGTRGTNQYGEDPRTLSTDKLSKVDLLVEKLAYISVIPDTGKVEYIHFYLNEEDEKLFYDIPPEYLKRLRPKLEKLIDLLDQNDITYGHQYAARQFYIGSKLIFSWQKDVKI